MLNLNFQNGQAPALNARNMNAIVESINTMQTQLANPFTFKGAVAYVDLPAKNNTINDTYYVTDRTCLYSWNGTEWEEASLSEDKYLAILNQITEDIADDYDPTKIYAIGDCCIYGNVLYWRNTYVNYAEDWNPLHWTSVNVIGEIRNTNSVIDPQRISYQLGRLPWVAGYTLTNGKYVVSEIRASENIFIYMNAGSQIIFPVGYVLRYACYYDVDFNTGINKFTLREQSEFISSPVVVPYDGYYRFAVGLSNAEAITAEQASSMFSADYPNGLSVAGNKINNIIPFVSSTNGLLLNEDGTVSLPPKKAGKVTVTDFIDVDPANLYTLKFRTKQTTETFTQYSRVIAYNENKEFLSVLCRQTIADSSYPDIDIILTIPAECKYIRVSYPYLIVDAEIECYSSTDQKLRLFCYTQQKSINTLFNEKVSLKKNNPDLVAQMINVAYSYKNQQSVTLEYGTNTPLSVTYDENAQSHHYIDCSTFLGFVLRGITFNESPYLITYTPEELYKENVRYFNTKQFVANPDYVWSTNPGQYEYELYRDVDYPEYAEARRASQIAQMMAEQGREVPLDKFMANIDAGDLIFFAKKDSSGEYIQPDRYRHITHIALIIDVADAPEGASWNPSLYPYKHTYIDVSGGTNVVRTKVLEEQTISPTVNGLGTLCCVMRPDLGSVSAPIFDGKKIVFNNDGSVTWEDA